MVRTHRLTLADAQSAISGDWTIAYREYVGPLAEYRPNGLETGSRRDPRCGGSSR